MTCKPFVLEQMMWNICICSCDKKPSTYLVGICFPTYLPIYKSYFLENGLPSKPDINSVDFHPQLNYNGQPVDGVPVGARSL
jgi:hypothetical protein